MKKIALISSNKILAQSLSVVAKSMPDLNFELLLLLNSQQALLDAEVFEIDVALIDVMDGDIKEKEKAISFCEKVKKSLPDCRILLLISQDDLASRENATNAKKKQIIEDFVFYDSSLKYLFSKLAAF